MASTRTSNKLIGSRGESLAASFLERRGFEILEKNFRYGHGEIDLIARKENLVVFCEVKTRRSRAYGAGEEAVDLRKQSQIRLVAEGYISKRNLALSEFRFDVIVVEIKGNTTTIRLIEDAF